MKKIKNSYLQLTQSDIYYGQLVVSNFKGGLICNMHSQVAQVMWKKSLIL